jgi:DNA-binding transcriptional ArsR family regulator
VNRPIESIDDPRLVRALSHPLRVRILAILEERTASAVEMSRMLRAPLGVVAYHVRTLDRLGLIELEREIPVRGAVQRFFRARERPTVSAQAWAEAAPVAKQAMIGATLQQIHDFAQASNASGGFDRTDAHITRTALKLDAQGFERLAGALGEVLREVDEIEQEVAARQSGDDAPPVEDAGLVMMLFDAQPFSAGVVSDPDGA